MAFNIYYRSDGKSLKNWCRENDVSYETATVYLNRGYTVDDACIEAKKARIRHKNRKMLMLNDKPLHQCVSTSEYVAIKRHVRKRNISVEEAIKMYKFNKANPTYMTTVKKNKPVIDLRTNITYESIKICAKELHYSTFKVRYLAEKGKILKYGEKKPCTID